jgi:biotin operon repressor
MPLYTFQCAHERGCGRPFPLEKYMNLYQYEQSRARQFKDIECPRCGRMGAKRWFGPGSMPHDITPKGTFGRTNSPGLKGKMYYGKEERDRMTDSVGTVIDDSRSDYQGGSRNPGAVKHIMVDGKLTELVRPEKPSEKQVVTWLELYGEPASAKKIASKTGLSVSAVRQACYRLKAEGGPLANPSKGRYSYVGYPTATGAAPPNVRAPRA